MRREDDGVEVYVAPDDATIFEKNRIRIFKEKLLTGEDLPLEDMPAFTAWDFRTFRVEKKSFLYWALWSGNTNNIQIFAPYATAEDNPFSIFLSEDYPAFSEEAYKGIAKVLVKHVDLGLCPRIDDLNTKVEFLRAGGGSRSEAQKLHALIDAITQRQAKEAKRRAAEEMMVAGIGAPAPGRK